MKTIYSVFYAVVFLGLSVTANATVVTIGNLSYDGTVISGDGSDYLGFDTLASYNYGDTLGATTTGAYSDFRIADTANADFFIIYQATHNNLTK